MSQSSDVGTPLSLKQKLSQKFEDDVDMNSSPCPVDSPWEILKATKSQGEVHTLAERIIKESSIELPQFIIHLLLQFRLCCSPNIFDPDDGEAPGSQLSRIQQRLQEREQAAGARDEEEHYSQRSPDDDYELMVGTKNGADEANWKIFFTSLGECSTIPILRALLEWSETLTGCFLKSIRQATTIASLSMLDGLNARLHTLYSGRLDNVETFEEIRELLASTIFAQHRRANDKDVLIRTKCIEFLKMQATKPTTPFGQRRWIHQAYRHIEDTILYETSLNVRQAAAKTLEQILCNPHSDFSDPGKELQSLLEVNWNCVVGKDIHLRFIALQNALVFAQRRKIISGVRTLWEENEDNVKQTVITYWRRVTDEKMRKALAPMFDTIFCDGVLSHANTPQRLAVKAITDIATAFEKYGGDGKKDLISNCMLEFKNDSIWNFDNLFHCLKENEHNENVFHIILAFTEALALRHKPADLEGVMKKIDQLMEVGGKFRLLTLFRIVDHFLSHEPRPNLTVAHQSFFKTTCEHALRTCHDGDTPYETLTVCCHILSMIPETYKEMDGDLNIATCIQAGLEKAGLPLAHRDFYNRISAIARWHDVVTPILNSFQNYISSKRCEIGQTKSGASTLPEWFALRAYAAMVSPSGPAIWNSCIVGMFVETLRSTEKPRWEMDVAMAFQLILKLARHYHADSHLGPFFDPKEDRSVRGSTDNHYPTVRKCMVDRFKSLVLHVQRKKLRPRMSRTKMAHLYGIGTLLENRDQEAPITNRDAMDFFLSLAYQLKTCLHIPLYRDIATCILILSRSMNLGLIARDIITRMIKLTEEKKVKRTAIWSMVFTALDMCRENGLQGVYEPMVKLLIGACPGRIIQGGLERGLVEAFMGKIKQFRAEDAEWVPAIMLAFNSGALKRHTFSFMSTLHGVKNNPSLRSHFRDRPETATSRATGSDGTITMEIDDDW